MSASLPNGFYANLIRHGFPSDHEFKVALFKEPQSASTYSSDGECEGEGYEAKTLTGYRVEDFGHYATLGFDSLVDWFNATIVAHSAVVFDATTGVVVSIMNFDKPSGVVGGVFSLNLHPEGVLRLGEA